MHFRFYSLPPVVSVAEVVLTCEAVIEAPTCTSNMSFTLLHQIYILPYVVTIYFNVILAYEHVTFDVFHHRNEYMMYMQIYLGSMFGILSFSTFSIISRKTA